MTQDQGWEELLQLVKEATLKNGERGQSQYRWLPPNRIVYGDRWQVQCNLSSVAGKYFIRMERFVAAAGTQNIGLRDRDRSMLLKMTLEVSSGEAFWLFTTGTTVKSADLARRILKQLQDFHDEYRLSIIDAH